MKSFFFRLRISSIGTVFQGTSSNIKAISTFNEYQYFTGHQTTVPQSAFYYSAIEEITFPNVIRIIGRTVFGQCWQLREMVVPEGITKVDNQWIWGSYRLAFIDLPSTLTSIVGYGLSPHQGSSYQVNYNVIIHAITPPTVDSHLSDYTKKLIAIYVPNESVVTYRETSIWSSLRSKIRGFLDMPTIIIKNGTYTISPRDIFESYSNLQVSIEGNDYLTLVSVEDNVATIVASGITSSTDATVAMSYSFVYKGSTISGTVNIPILYKEVIDFEDAEVKRICVANWGGEYCASTNKYGVPGELTMEQALGSPARKAASVLSRLKFVTLTRTFSTTIPIYGLRYSYPGRNLGDCSVIFNTDTGHTIQVYCYYSRCWYVDGHGYSDVFSLWINLGSNKYLSFFSDSVLNPYVSEHVTFNNVIGYRPSEYDGRISALVDSNDI